MSNLSPGPVLQPQNPSQSDVDVKVRSTSDILSLINKSSVPDISSSEKGEDSGDEIYQSRNCEGPNDQLSTLSENSYNISHNSSLTSSKESFRLQSSFTAPPKQVGKVNRGWNTPYTSGGPPGMGRRPPGEENQTPETR